MDSALLDECMSRVYLTEILLTQKISFDATVAFAALVVLLADFNEQTEACSFKA